MGAPEKLRLGAFHLRESVVAAAEELSRHDLVMVDGARSLSSALAFFAPPSAKLLRVREML